MNSDNNHKKHFSKWITYAIAIIAVVLFYFFFMNPLAVLFNPLFWVVFHFNKKNKIYRVARNPDSPA